METVIYFLNIRTITQTWLMPSLVGAVPLSDDLS